MAESTSFNMLFDSGLSVNSRLSDIKIRVGAGESGWVFPAHQLVLRASSPVFSAMLNGEYEESKKEEIVIEDISPNIFYKVLLYIYKGELRLQSMAEAIAVYGIADKYQIDKLKSACADKMEKLPITWDTFWDLLHQCFDHFPAVPFQLKLKLMVFLDENAKAVLNSENFFFLSRELMTMIISRNPLRSVTELLICEAMTKWAEMQCFKTFMEPTSENQRKVLGDAFHKMKFSFIDTKQLLASPVYNLLTEQEASQAKDIFETKSHVPCFLALSRGSNYLIQNREIPGSSRGPIYFVFAKDAFVHELILSFNITSRIKRIVLSTINKGGRDVFVSYGKKCNTPFTSLYVKAFVCYKISFEYEEDKDEDEDEDDDDDSDEEDEKTCYLSRSIGYDYENANAAVFFSVNQEYVRDYTKLVSPDYWKNAFLTQTFECDGCKTCIDYVKATFY